MAADTPGVQTRPTHAPDLLLAVSSLDATSDERPQPVTNNLDISQDQPPEFDLIFKQFDITERSGGANKATNVVMEAVNRGLN